MDMPKCIMLYCIVCCVAKATGNSDQTYFEISGGYKVKHVLRQFKDMSVSECAAKCMSYARDGSCKMAGYDMSPQTCQLSADNTTVTDSDSSSFVITMLNMCGPPDTPNYGSAVVSNGRTLCTFSCSPGYTLVGVTSLQCVEGTWNGFPPTCQDCYPGTPWEYNGTKDTTQKGTLCQRWDSQSPHPHPHTDLQYFPDVTLADAKNYCRNPKAGKHDPWCMTSDPGEEWDYCNIIKC